MKLEKNKIFTINSIPKLVTINMIIFLFYQRVIASDKTFAEIFFVLLSKCVYKLAVVE